MIVVTDFETSIDKADEFDHIIGMLDPNWQDRFDGLHQPPKRFVWWADDVLVDRLCNVAPKKQQIEEIIKIFKEHDMHKKSVLVHCRAGISRSTAIAIGLLIVSGKSVSEAFEQIHIIRDCLWPNDTILKHFDDILGLNGELVKFDKEWKNKHRFSFWIPSDKVKDGEN